MSTHIHQHWCFHSVYSPYQVDKVYRRIGRVGFGMMLPNKLRISPSLEYKKYQLGTFLWKEIVLESYSGLYHYNDYLHSRFRHILIRKSIRNCLICPHSWHHWHIRAQRSHQHLRIYHTRRSKWKVRVRSMVIFEPTGWYFLTFIEVSNPLGCIHWNPSLTGAFG